MLLVRISTRPAHIQAGRRINSVLEEGLRHREAGFRRSLYNDLSQLSCKKGTEETTTDG